MEKMKPFLRHNIKAENKARLPSESNCKALTAQIKVEL